MTSDAPHRNTRVTVRLRDHEADRLERAAEAARETRAELIRRALLRESDRVLRRARTQEN